MSNNKTVTKIIDDHKITKSSGQNQKLYIYYVASAIQILKNVHNGTCNHMITYHNKISSSIVFCNILRIINEKIYGNRKVYIHDLLSKMSMTTRRKITNEFIESERSILCSSKILRDGVNIPIIDSICFVDPIYSTKDIVQSIGRALNLYPGKENAKIFLPIMSNSDRAFRNVTTILFALKMTDIRIIESLQLQNFGHVPKINFRVNNFVDENKTELIDFKKWNENIFNKIHNTIDEYPSMIKNLILYVDKNKCLPTNNDDILYKWCCDMKRKYIKNKLNEQCILQLELINEWKWIDVVPTIFVTNKNTNPSPIHELNNIIIHEFIRNKQFEKLSMCTDYDLNQIVRKIICNTKISKNILPCYEDHKSTIQEIIRNKQFFKLLGYIDYDSCHMKNRYICGKSLIENIFIHCKNNEIIRHVIKNNYFDSLKILAAKYGNTDIIKLLIDNNCISEHENNMDYNEYARCIEHKYINENDPIHMAVKYDNIDIVKLLIDAGINLERKNIDGNYPIHLAIKYNNIDAVKLLVDAKVNLECTDRDGNYPIHLAINGENVDIIKLLINAQINLEHADNDGNRPIHLAITGGYVDIIKLLIDTKVNLECVDENGDSPIHLAIIRDNIDIVRLLMDAKVNLEHENRDGNRPIHLAIADGYHNIDLNVNIVKLLIDAKVSLECENRDGNRPIHLAINSGNVDIIKLLYLSKINLECENKDGNRPVHISIMNLQVDTTILLINAKVNLECENKNGNNPIHLAAKYYHVQIIKLLIDAGIDQTRKDKNGKTAKEIYHANTPFK